MDFEHPVAIERFTSQTWNNPIVLQSMSSCGQKYQCNGKPYRARIILQSSKLPYFHGDVLGSNVLERSTENEPFVDFRNIPIDVETVYVIRDLHYSRRAFATGKTASQALFAITPANQTI